MKEIFKLLCIISISYIVNGYNECPNPEDIKPCTCSDHSISCNGNEIHELFLKNLNEGYYEKLNIESTSITKITDNFYGNVVFDEINVLDNNNLVEIEENAFKLGPKDIGIKRNPKLNIDSLFKLTKNLKRTGTLVFNGNIKELPTKAFRLINSDKNKKLHKLDFSYSNITRIRTNFLDGILNLGVLYLEHNQISVLDDFAFALDPQFADLSTVYIHLNNNNLTADSFTENSFKNLTTSHGLTMYLNNNVLTTISEKIFGDVIKHGTLFDFENNPFNCDCNMIWLFNTTIKSKIDGEITCINFQGRNLFEMEESQFNCRTTKQTTASTISTTNTNPIITASTNIMTRTHTSTVIPKTNSHVITTDPNNNLCPNSEQITPCICDSNSLIIECKSITDEMLKNIGPKINTGSDIFKELYIHNNNITKIGTNTLINGNFDNIIIENNNNLVNIDIYSSFNSKCDKLIIRKNSKLNDNHLYGMLKNFDMNLVDFSENALTEIPSNAFGNENFWPNLNTIILANNQIKFIATNAFYGLNHLKHLSLEHNLIDVIKDDSFDFTTLSSNERLFLSLSYNKLNEKIITERSIQIPNNSSVRIHFESNIFTKLDEHVFKPLIYEKSNELDFDGNDFKCDCNMKWILGYDHNLHNIFCENLNSSIFELTEKELRCN